MEAIVSTNDVNNYSVSELNYLRESIENMNKFNQVEILRILHKNKDVTLNENKISLDFHVIVAYGVSIRAVSDNLIANVKYKVEAFTGIEVENINILVEGVRVID